MSEHNYLHFYVFFWRKQGCHVTNFARKQKYQVTNVDVEKIKLSRLLVQRINEFKMNEIQLKTTVKFKIVLTNSNCKLFLSLELTGYKQAADDSKILHNTLYYPRFCH